MTVTIRDLTLDDIDALAHVLVTAIERAFRGLVPDKCLEFTEAESAANWRRFLVDGEGLPAGDFMLVAEADGQVVGYTWGGANDQEPEYAGEIRQIMMLPGYQGRGIGRQLVCALARRLAEQNIYSLRVWAVCVNPNGAFYQHLGAVFVREFPYDWDGYATSGCVYGWADTAALLEPCSS
jgi:GNAT superfamily N-acetyltransferase